MLFLDGVNSQDFQVGVPNRGGRRAARKPPIRLTDEPPEGLTLVQLSDEHLLQQARREVDNMMATHCAGQIASNRHFFVHLPFPLGGTREDDTPLFPFGSKKGMTDPNLSILIIPWNSLCNLSTLCSPFLTFLTLSQLMP